jgi:hypothetical protein
MLKYGYDSKWYPTWADFLPLQEMDNDNLIKLSLNDMDTINNSVGGQSENWWYNRYDGWGPVFRIDNPTSGAYYQNKHFLSSDPHEGYGDTWQLLYFKPGLPPASDHYPLSSQPLTSNWLGGSSPYIRTFGSSSTDINPIITVYHQKTGSNASSTCCPMQWEFTLGLIADAFGGTHHSFKGVIIYPVTTSVQVSQRSTTKKTYSGTTLRKDVFVMSGSDIDDMDTNWSILSRIYNVIHNSLSNTDAGGDAPWYYVTNSITRTKSSFSNASPFNVTYNGMTYTAECNSLYSTTTKYYYTPFKINTNYNWFYGSLFVQLADILQSHRLALGGIWDAGNGMNYLYVLDHPNFDADATSDDITPLWGYIYDINGLCSSAMSSGIYRIPPKSLWLSSKHYNYNDQLGDMNINRYGYDVDDAGKINKLINSVWNGAVSPIYEFFAGLPTSELQTITTNLQTMLGIPNSYFNGLKTKIGSSSSDKGITVVTICAYVTLQQINSLLAISSGYTYWWYNYKSSSDYSRIVTWPASVTGGMMIDLFYIVFFDDYTNEPTYSTPRTQELNLNDYAPSYAQHAYWCEGMGSTNNVHQINLDYNILKLFQGSQYSNVARGNWKFPYLG